jgi:CelD/BcsL family acetyltransferase involved in cellulose biosynthesis
MCLILARSLRMNFEVFDTLECACGERQLPLRDRILIRTEFDKPVAGVLCSHYCGYKNCSISSGMVTPADCNECRAQSIIRGSIRCKCGREWRVEDGKPNFSLAESKKLDENGMRVVTLDYRNDPRWRPFVSSHPEGTIFHHPGWMNVLEDEYDRPYVVLACEQANGKLTGLLPLLYTRGFNLVGGQRTARRVSSLPRTPVAGPLTTSRGASRSLLEAAIRLVEADGDLLLELKTQSPEFDGLAGGLIRVPWNPSFVLELPSNPEDLTLGDSRSRRHHIRGAVNRAIRAGLNVRSAETESDLRSWYALYLDSMRRRLVPARPFRLFRAMWGVLRPRGQMELLLAEKSEAGASRILAGSIFLKLGRTVYYAFTGCRREDFSTHPHDLLQWHAIQKAVKDGYRRYDFGEVPHEASELARFKSKWGARESNFCRYYYPTPEFVEARGLPLNSWSKKLLSKTWDKLPLSVTAHIGDWVYGFL